MTALIHVEGLSRRHRTAAGEVAALTDVDLSIDEGAFVALVGPSGSGKTTLLDCLTGLDRPDDGRVRIGDTIITDLDPDEATAFRRRSVATVFQAPVLLPHLSAAENLDVVLRLRGVARAGRARRITTALGEVGLSGFADHQPSQLSGGQRQRVAIARALVTESAVVVADEPTAQLDTDTAAEVLAVLRRRVDEHGMTLLVATHDAAVVALADRTIELVDGRVVRDGRPEGADR